MDYINLIESYMNKKVEVYSHIDSWRDFDVYIVDNIVFRFPRTEEKRISMKREKDMLDRIRSYITLPIPNYEIVNDIYMVCSMISWIHLPEKIEVYTDLIVTQIVWFLRELHSIPIAIVTDNNDIPEDRNALLEFVEKIKVNLEMRVRHLLTDEEWGLMKKYIEDLFLKYVSIHTALVHTDLQGKNIIYDPDKQIISWIIDFTDARVWSIELDFCHFLDVGESILWKFIEKYRWFHDDDFFERVFFLARRNLIFEINNNIFSKENESELIRKLKKYKFIS